MRKNRQEKNINTQINRYNHKKQNNELCMRCDQGVSCFFSSPQALNFRGRLKLVHGQHRVSEDGTLVPPQLAFFCVATPMQPPAILEIRTKTLIFQTKHRLDFSPMGIDSRYVPPLPASQLPALSSQLSTLNSWISLLMTRHVFFLWRQREAGPGLLRGGAAHEGLRLQLHPRRRHDVLRRHAHSE